MIKQERKEGGRFTSKSAEPREVRSLRLTETTWQKLGAVAESQGITRADLVEHMVEQGILEQASAGEPTVQRVAIAIEGILNDPVVTRKGKDRGSVKRALQALLNLLS